ncbi:hypothetical protein [Falsibacillus pallidus]|uniref:Uncharacterized protein n=1 Tax=Falsibacillus pallidus TaxID=493781 RepID=A0A370G804_9BACI|nr:hypothetical protein [Falsibacillus pallidus]RDI39921.1 hypothetical protein DFR59_11480 [Falsibacillus pallidus]
MELLDNLKNRQILLEEYIPAKNITARLLFCESDRILEWIFSREGRYSKSYLIEHTENQMRSLGEQSLLEELKERELYHRIMEKIASAFYRERIPQRRRRGDFEIHLAVFEELEQSGFDEERLSRDEICFFNETMRDLKKIDEANVIHEGKRLWRDSRTIDDGKSSILQMMEKLHGCYPISMKMRKFSFAEAHQLFSHQKIRRMTGIGYKWLNWKVYSYWHDEYFYLFTSTKTNPSSIEEMYEKLAEKERKDFKIVFEQKLQEKPFQAVFTDDNQLLYFLDDMGVKA